MGVMTETNNGKIFSMSSFNMAEFDEFLGTIISFSLRSSIPMKNIKC